MDHEFFMREAIRIAEDNIKVGGGPFGAVIVKDGRIVAEAVNAVVRNNDPTAHAEVKAIRKACKALETYDLTGCTIYTSCEPCPMCLGAIYWAHIDKVYYGNKANDAKNIGFDDSHIYNEIEKPHKDRAIEFINLLPEEAIATFNKWRDMDDKIPY